MKCRFDPMNRSFHDPAFLGSECAFLLEVDSLPLCEFGVGICSKLMEGIPQFSAFRLERTVGENVSKNCFPSRRGPTGLGLALPATSRLSPRFCVRQRPPSGAGRPDSGDATEVRDRPDGGRDREHARAGGRRRVSGFLCVGTADAFIRENRCPRPLCRTSARGPGSHLTRG
jgi:hypothetical protein